MASQHQESKREVLHSTESERAGRISPLQISPAKSAFPAVPLVELTLDELEALFDSLHMEACHAEQERVN